jgi:hypothetical protein
MGGIVLFVLFLICYIIIIKNINIASDNDMRIVVLCMRFRNIVLRQNKAIIRKLFASWTGKIGILILFFCFCILLLNCTMRISQHFGAKKRPRLLWDLNGLNVFHLGWEMWIMIVFLASIASILHSLISGLFCVNLKKARISNFTPCQYVVHDIFQRLRALVT